ncbi:carboxylesterase/lipase family protein [Ramlibacter sp. WS9]|uniref:carboxylesterase/lipase family protein n=1 Tax=Ramlibacter sp. WS9 TaxID=1882741 RepID=UPI0018EE5EA3|nr:carboxylesterase family protein [Ramlibacter sp. WS9]
MKFTTRLMPVLGASMAALLFACGGSSDDPLVRNTTYGQVQGAALAPSSTYAWKGIPFAQPPVGSLRWKAPAEPQAWSTSRDATKFGNACLQNGRIYGPGSNNTYDGTIATTLNTPVGSEDCLTLNVWRPADDSSGLPVIFFAYGGSNISGYTADPMYDGAALAKAANAVVVTANYRVGPLGFFNLAQLKSGTNASEDSGNFALLDLIAALKFVKNNAAAFGGNAGNVTLMGQSAGAINVWALMTSPLASGLFHRAVPLSGGISLASNLPPGNIPTLNPATTYATQGNNLLAKLLIADGKATDTATAQAYAATQTSAQIADYMRSKSGGTILTTLLTGGLSGSGPIPDGTVIPVDPISAIAAGHYNKVPVLAGNTVEEGKLFAPFLTLLGGPPGFKITDAARFTMMQNFNPDAPATITENDILDPAYTPSNAPTTGWTAKTTLLGNIFMVPSRDSALNALKTQQSNVWYYQFKWAQEPAPWNTIYGSAHAFDLPFLFGNFGPSLFSNAIASTANKPGRLALSAAMMASIGAFARNGDPNNATLGTTWQPWPSKLIFDATPTAAAITTQ